MEAVGLLQKTHDARQALGPFSPRDEAPFDAHQKSHHAEARTSGSDDVRVVVGVVAVDVDAFAGRSGVGFRTVPEVAEGALLDFADEGAVAQALRRDGLRFVDPRVSAEFDAGRAECRLQGCAHGGSGRQHQSPESGRSEQDRSEQDASEHGG